MTVQENVSIPDIEVFHALVMMSASGALRLSVKAREILGPIFAANGFDINNLRNVQQYRTLQRIVDGRIATELEALMSATAGKIDLDKLDNDLDAGNLIDCLYLSLRRQEGALLGPLKPILKIVKSEFKLSD